MKRAIIDFLVIPPWGTIIWQTASGGSKLVGGGSIFIGVAYYLISTKPSIERGAYNAETSAWLQIILLAWATSRLLC